MTREERVDWLKQIENDIYVDSLGITHEEYMKSRAIHETIEAMQTELCEDAISRETVASEFADWFGYNYQNQIFYKRIKSMPSVTAEQRTGKWIFRKDNYPFHWMCNKCGKTFKTDFNFCPNCGAKMESEDKEEINPYEKCKTCGQNRESCCGCPEVLELERKKMREAK